MKNSGLSLKDLFSVRFAMCTYHHGSKRFRKLPRTLYQGSKPICRPQTVNITDGRPYQLQKSVFLNKSTIIYLKEVKRSHFRINMIL